MLSRTSCGVTAVALALCGLLSAAPANAADPPTVTAAEKALRAAAAEGEHQADLVAGEDQRVMEALIKGLPTRENPGINHAYRDNGSGYTLVLTKRRKPYSFDDLRKLAESTLVPQAKGTFLLTESIIVGPGATLSISPSQPLKIKMKSGPSGFVSIIAQGGRLRLNGTAAAPISFESWDTSRGRTDTDVTDGRAYVRASGQLVVQHTSFSRLGFWSGRTGGVSVVGSGSSLGQDLVVTAVADEKNDGSDKGVLPAGKLPAEAQDLDISYGTRISNATMTGNAFGLFVTGSSGARIEDTVIRRSLVDGLVLHRDVDSASVKNVRVEKSGSDGVVISRKVEATVLTQLVVRENGRDGIVVAGRPIANGPSPSGSSTRAFGNNVLTASQSIDNVRIGIHVVGGTAVRVQNNAVTGGRSGIVVSDGATEVEIDSNRVAGTTANGIQVRESRKVAVTGNVVRNAQTGIHVRNASGTVSQNSTSGVTLHGITFVGAVAGSVATENLLSGSGTSAIDVVRVADEQVPLLTNNDLSGWSQTVTSDSLLSILLHPLTVIWMLVALLLLAMSRPRRGGHGMPYRTDPLMPGSGTLSGSPSPVEPSREREDPVFAIPERRSPVPVSVQLPAAVPAPSSPRPTPPPLPVSVALPVISSAPGASVQVATNVTAAAGPPVPAPAVAPRPAAVAPVSPELPLSVPALTPARGPMLSPVPELRPRSTPAGNGAGSGVPRRPASPSTATGPGPRVSDRSSRPAEVSPRPAETTLRPSEEIPPRTPETSGWEHESDRVTVARTGTAVIDLAIREARLNPAAPRRRRTSGR
jgi:hypothetical protein